MWLLFVWIPSFTFITALLSSNSQCVVLVLLSPSSCQLVMKFMRFGVFFSFSPPLSRFICKILTSDNLIKLKAISRRSRQIGKMTCRNNKKGNFLGTTDKKFQKRLWANYWLIMRPNYCTWSYDDVVARNRTTN